MEARRHNEQCTREKVGHPDGAVTCGTATQIQVIGIIVASAIAVAAGGRVVLAQGWYGILGRRAADFAFGLPKVQLTVLS